MAAPKKFSTAVRHSSFIRQDSCLILSIRRACVAPDFVQQLKGGDPMSSEKPGEAIGFVCNGSLVEQPLRAI